MEGDSSQASVCIKSGHVILRAYDDKLSLNITAIKRSNLSGLIQLAREIDIYNALYF